jgi:hypothetical protein
VNIQDYSIEIAQRQGPAKQVTNFKQGGPGSIIVYRAFANGLIGLVEPVAA